MVQIYWTIFCAVSQIILILFEMPRPRVCTQRKMDADSMQLCDIYEKYLSMWGIFTEI
jgi:hypothetical protein